MKLTEEEQRQLTMLRNSDYLREDDHTKTPWFRWLAIGGLTWLVVLGIFVINRL